jgi:hypothetical protein
MVQVDDITRKAAETTKIKEEKRIYEAGGGSVCQNC